jgi:selenocysteine lyase/cysteine desulfurase
MHMIPNQRHLFDIPSHITYLNIAWYSPLLKQVYEAGQRGLDRKYHPWEIKPPDLIEEAETLRGLFASLIGASANEIAIIPSTAYGVATAAANLPLGTGRKIIVLQYQFPSNAYSWRVLAEDRAANLVTIARPDDWDWTSAVLEEINDETDIVSVPPVHWMDGSCLDLVRIGKRCREKGAAFVVNVTQAVGAMPLDIS